MISKTGWTQPKKKQGITPFKVHLKKFHFNAAKNIIMVLFLAFCYSFNFLSIGVWYFCVCCWGKKLIFQPGGYNKYRERVSGNMQEIVRKEVILNLDN